MNKSAVKKVFVGWYLSAAIVSGLGQGVLYTSRSAFEAALLSSTTATFEDLLSSRLDWPFVQTASTSGLTISAAYLTVADPDGDLHPIPGSGKYLWNWDGTTPVFIDLPPGVTAFGADFACGRWWVPSFAGTLTVNLASGRSQVFDFNGATETWLFGGVTFPEPIVQVIFHDGGSFLPGLHEEMLDNVTYGVAIPEASSTLLMLLGVAWLWVWGGRAERCGGASAGERFGDSPKKAKSRVVRFGNPQGSPGDSAPACR